MRYIIKIDNGYYHSESRWKPVEREMAEELTHKEARFIRDKLKRLGYESSVEEK